MLEKAIMIEGQDGLNWLRWQSLAKAVEDLGFDGLYRSDHFTNARPPDKDSLELWVSLTWLASHTSRIKFGPLVTPVSFRHPAFTARMAAAVDDLSGGRLTLGVGAGWQEREHEKFGFELLDIQARFNRFEEGIEVITRLLRNDEPFSYQGDFYEIDDAILLPRPKRKNGPPLLIGGNGENRTLPLTARYADKWNALMIPPEEFQRLNKHLDSLIKKEDRQPSDVRRSMMTGCIFGQTEDEVKRKIAQRTQGKRNVHDLIKRGLFVGTAAEIMEQLQNYEDAGLQCVMFQWLDMEDLEGLEAFAKGLNL